MSSAKPEFNVQRQIKMGLGDAILRLIHVEIRYSQGVSTMPEHLRQEREMIVQALNQYDLDLGFDCNGDGIPDNVAIFQKTAETSCCRLVGKDTSRKPVSAPAPVQAVAPITPRRTSSRRAASKE